MIWINGSQTHITICIQLKGFWKKILEEWGNPHPEIFIKECITYYCDSYRQPRIKHDNVWQRYVPY